MEGNQVVPEKPNASDRKSHIELEEFMFLSFGERSIRCTIVVDLIVYVLEIGAYLCLVKNRMADMEFSEASRELSGKEERHKSER